ncbi:MAG: hypothetical protein ABI315_13075 [Bacteroidia bacterium]
MKKSLIILFASFYLMLASGLNIRLHYCGGRLKYISLFSTGGESDCCGIKMKSKNCCNEKSVFIKVNDNHFGGNYVNSLNNPVKSIAGVTFIQLFEIKNSSTPYTLLPYYAPPPALYNNPIYLKHRVLII